MKWLIFLLLFLSSFSWFLLDLKKEKQKGTSYRMFFILGIVMMGTAFIVSLGTIFYLGLIFFFVGIANRNKWKNIVISEKKRIILLVLMMASLLFCLFLR